MRQQKLKTTVAEKTQATLENQLPMSSLCLHLPKVGESNKILRFSIDGGNLA